MNRTAWGLDTSHAAGWIAQAACRDEDPELFFPTGTSGPALLQTQHAQAVCRRCPAMDECRQWALATGQTSGIWGGLSEAELLAATRNRGVQCRG